MARISGRSPPMVDGNTRPGACVAARLDPRGRPDIHSEGSGLVHLMHALSHASAETGRSRRPSPEHTGFGLRSHSG
eukprot:8545433-Pyramimonas_sp.AAC.1